MEFLFVPEGDAFLPLAHTGAGWTIPMLHGDRSGVANSVINYHDERGFVGHGLVHCLDNPKPEDESKV